MLVRGGLDHEEKTPMGYTDVVKSISGLTHYYPLTSDGGDVVGKVNGTVKGSGVTFSSKGAKFTGSGYVELGDADDFSVANKGALSILVFLTISNWKGAGASEYVHWMGKGQAGAHEWTFRHYVQGGSGEASTREGRCSFYHFNPAGGLGAGSYYQDGTHPTTERMFVATCDMKQLQLYVNGTLRDTDALSGYSVVPKNTSSVARVGTRDMSTGYLIGTVRRVAFFNRVLTLTDINKLYTARAQDDGGSVTPPTPTPDPPPAVDNPFLATADTVVQKHNELAVALQKRGVI